MKSHIYLFSFVGILLAKPAPDVVDLNERYGKLAQRAKQLEETRSVSSPAFSARLTVPTQIDDSPVVFDWVDLNIADGYDEFTGVFSPPISGTYLLTIHTRNNGENGYIQIKSDDALLCEAFVTDTVNGANMASCTVVAPLSTSNSVRVTGETSNPADILEAGFSGHLIEADSFDMIAGNPTEGLNAKYEKLMETTEHLKEEVEHLKQRQMLSTPSFSTRLNGQQEITDSPVLFDVVDVNIGNGYDVYTGVFEPPVDGTYLLTMYAGNTGSNGPIHIKSDSTLLCSAFVSDMSNGAKVASCTAVAELVTSNSVRVTGDSVDPADIETAGFAGHLIEAA